LAGLHEAFLYGYDWMEKIKKTIKRSVSDK